MFTLSGASSTISHLNIYNCPFLIINKLTHVDSDRMRNLYIYVIGLYITLFLFLSVHSEFKLALSIPFSFINIFDLE